MKLWIASITTTLFLLILLLAQWQKMTNPDVHPMQQLTNPDEVREYLYNEHVDLMEEQGSQRIVTGIFIKSLQFFNSSEVHFTGYIWQHFAKEQYAGVPNSEIEPQFILPEQVNAGSDISPTLIYREDSSFGEVFGWEVEATLKQSFDYSRYPFDHKTVWLRLLPKQFSKNVILVPDFGSYIATGVKDIFGIDQNIVLGTWIRENTYFDYQATSYDTNFGITDYIGQSNFPELHYNFIIKRRFDNAFTVHLLPLFLVSILLFAAMLTVSNERETSERLGFNTSGFLGMCSALFFVVLLAHIQLREQFAGATVVYLEYYYLLMYAMLVVCTVNAYLFAMRPAMIEKFIVYKDNIIPKICFWPTIFIVLNIVTYQFY